MPSFQAVLLISKNSGNIFYFAIVCRKPLRAVAPSFFWTELSVFPHKILKATRLLTRPRFPRAKCLRQESSESLNVAALTGTRP